MHRTIDTVEAVLLKLRLIVVGAIHDAIDNYSEVTHIQLAIAIGIGINFITTIHDEIDDAGDIHHIHIEIAIGIAWLHSIVNNIEVAPLVHLLIIHLGTISHMQGACRNRHTKEETFTIFKVREMCNQTIDISQILAVDKGIIFNVIYRSGNRDIRHGGCSSKCIIANSLYCSRDGGVLAAHKQHIAILLDNGIAIVAGIIG